MPSRRLRSRFALAPFAPVAASLLLSAPLLASTAWYAAGPPLNGALDAPLVHRAPQAAGRGLRVIARDGDHGTPATIDTPTAGTDIATARMTRADATRTDAARTDATPTAGAIAAANSAAADAATPAPALAFSEPGISPDGREIAFVSGGDIWTVPAAGGEARLLVSHPATESRPLYSPDGRSLAFVSTRTGNGDIYVLTLDTGDLRRITYDDARESLSGWSPDSRWLQFSSSSQEIAGMEDIFRVGAQGGTPFVLTNDVYFNEFQGAVSPDGARLAYGARGIASSQWWRNGHSHLDESEIWIRRIGSADAAFQRVVPMGAKALWPMWSADGQALFYVSDRAKAENIWRVTVPAATSTASSSNGAAGTAAGGSRQAKTKRSAGASAAATATAPAPANAASGAAGEAIDGGRALTSFTNGRVLWPSISADGSRIAFERDFAIWTLDTASGQARALTIARRGAPAGAGTEHVTLSTRFRDLALSPDGKKIVFGARGDLFAVSAKDGGSAFRMTASAALDSSPAWTTDSRRIVYVAERDGTSELRLYDFATSADTALTSGPRDYAPSVAPNGESVAFLRNSREACIVGLAPAATPRASTAAASASDAAASTATANASTPTSTAKENSTPRAAGTRCIAQGAVATPFDAATSLAWSPDSRWIAVMTDGVKGFSNVSIVSVAGGDLKPVSFVGNSFGGSLTWSPDGTFLLFTTGQRTEPSQIARVDLVLRTPKFREDQFRDLFTPQPPGRPQPAPGTTARDAQREPAKEPVNPVKDSPREPAKDPAKDPAKEPGRTTPTTTTDTTKEPAETKTADGTETAAAGAAKKPKPTEIVFDDIRRRLSVVPVDLDADGVDISPDGKWLLITATSAGQQNLYVYSLDELATERPVPRQLTSTAGAKSRAQFSPDSKDVFYLENGRLFATAIERGTPRAIAATAELDVDFAGDRNELFTQAWSLLQENFYDPAFHGVDWRQARARFAPYAAGAATPDELRRVLSLMIGELNASHLGVGAPPGGATPTTGRLGLRFDAAEQAATGRLLIAEVIPLGPAAVTRTIAVGDVLIAVNGVTLDRTTSLDRLLDHTIDKRVTLTVETKGQRREAAVQPVSLTTEKGLRYRAWVESRRAYVAKASGGRLGYVHMPDMGAASLTQLYADLDADNQSREGVIVDLRNNNGGFVNAYALDVFTRRPYLHMTLRGRDRTPARTTLGQRALEAPTTLVVNQHSLSDAEDFTEGYRALKLGKVIGEPTAGWIIYTWNAALNDGSSLRLPRTRITDNRGQTMELNPRPVDVTVSRMPGDEAAGRDAQMDAAVKELLAQIGAERRAASNAADAPGSR